MNEEFKLPEYLSVTDTSTMLNIPSSQVRRMCRKGVLKYTTSDADSSIYRIETAALEEYLGEEWDNSVLRLNRRQEATKEALKILLELLEKD